MILLDVSHTSHTRARTGVQRIVRTLHATLAGEAIAICHDPWLHAWRPLENWERANLDRPGRPHARRSAQWPLWRRLRSRCRRRFGSPSCELPDHDGLLVPEVFSAGVAAALPGLFARVRGPRVALFHDALPLKFPELTAPGTVARFPAYLRELLQFDGVVAVSEDAREQLAGYWRWMGASRPPPLVALPHGIDPVRTAVAASPIAAGCPVILSVGTIEGRKNQLALLEACERLWQANARFELRLIGMVSHPTGDAALRRLRSLRAAGRPVAHLGAVDDERLAAAYSECQFTVYPSLAEGFGLPVAESLVRGIPCVCSGRGALGETARGGGCIALDSVDADSLAAAIGRLLAHPAELAALRAEAGRRTFRSTTDYVEELTTWMRSLRPD